MLIVIQVFFLVWMLIYVDRDRDGIPRTSDCDDADPAIYPGAEEACDGVDNDCSGIVDDAPRLSVGKDGRYVKILSWVKGGDGSVRILDGGCPSSN